MYTQCTDYTDVVQFVKCMHVHKFFCIRFFVYTCGHNHMREESRQKILLREILLKCQKLCVFYPIPRDTILT